MVKDRNLEMVSNPTHTKWLLDAINKVKHQKQRPNPERIGNAVRQNHNLSQDAVMEQLELAVKDGLIMKVLGKDGLPSYKDPAVVTQLKARSLQVDKNTDLTKIIIKSLRELDEPNGSGIKRIRNYIASSYNLDIQDDVDLIDQLKVSVQKGLSQGNLEKEGNVIRLPQKNQETESVSSSSNSVSYDEDSANDFSFEEKTVRATVAQRTIFCQGNHIALWFYHNGFQCAEANFVINFLKILPEFHWHKHEKKKNKFG